MKAAAVAIGVLAFAASALVSPVPMRLGEALAAIAGTVAVAGWAWRWTSGGAS